MAEKKDKQYVSDNAQLMAEWDWEENNKINLYPNEVTHGSTKTANWLCRKGHRFSARIDHRTIMGSNCPYCAGKRPILGINDLATTHPALLQEWDYKENPQLPEQFLAGSNKKASWICKICGHHWSAKIIDRAIKNTGCPSCMQIQRGKTRTSNTIIKNGSLAMQFPELASEWDYKNAPLTPADVHSNSRKKVWWIGKCGHTWQATIPNRVLGNDCPVCAGKTVLAGFNDLASKYPEISRQWHPTLNNGLLPNQVTAHSHRKVWWLCPECAEAYNTSISSRTSLGTGCPVCHNRTAVQGKNDLATTHPEIAKEWNYIKNNGLLPTNLVAGSNKRFWWICKKGHEWQANVVSRTSGRGCPVCAQDKRPINRQKTYLRTRGSLADNHPTIAKQWHPTRNGTLTPSQVTSGSSALVWWICEKGHEWEAIISSRTAGRGCPYCNNEHSTSFPEQVLLYYLSKATTAVNRYKYKNRELDIYLPDLNVGIEYNGRYYHRKRTKQDNEKYSFFEDQGIRVIIIYEGDITAVEGDVLYYQYINSDYLNLAETVLCILRLCGLPATDVDIRQDRAKIFEQFILQEKSQSLAVRYPWLIEEWDYERNGKLTPWQISYGSNKRIHWICKKCGYRWEAVAHSRKNCGCPCCANRVVVKGINDIGTTHPHLVCEWDYTKNEKKPENVVAGSHQYAWWVCRYGHSWRAQVKSRAQGTGCPICSKK